MEINKLTFSGMKWLYKNYLEKINYLTFGVTDSVIMDINIGEFEDQIKRFTPTCQVALKDMAATLQGANDAAYYSANQRFHTQKN